MDAENITRHQRGKGTINSNYRLLGEPIKLTLRQAPQYVRPDGDGYEVVGVSPNPVQEVEVPQRVDKRDVRMRLGRKQQAARAYIPKETVRIVRLGEPAPIEVVEVRAKGIAEVVEVIEKGGRGVAAKIAAIRRGIAQKEDIAMLEHRIRELMEIVEKPQRDALRKALAIERLERLFNVERKVR